MLYCLNNFGIVSIDIYIFNSFAIVIISQI